MHLSTNISHWVCVLTGLLLVVSGLASHGQRAASIGLRAAASEHDYAGVIKRAVLVSIGLVAIAYGVSRMVILW